MRNRAGGTVSYYQQWEPARGPRAESTARQELAAAAQVDAEEEAARKAALAALRKSARTKSAGSKPAGSKAAGTSASSKAAGKSAGSSAGRSARGDLGGDSGGKAPTNHARPHRPGVERPRQPAPHRPVTHSSGGGGWAGTAQAVDRLLEVGGPRDTLRAAIASRSEDRLRAAVPLARTLVEDVLDILERVEERLDDETAKRRPWTVDAQPSITLLVAAEFPWDALLRDRDRTSDAGWVESARSLQQALAHLEADDLPFAYTALHQDLVVLGKALKAADGTRPLSRRRLLGLLTAVLRVVETVAIGILAAAITAVQKGEDHTAAAFTAAVGLAVSTTCEQAIKILRGAMHPRSAGERLAEAHDELGYVTSDLVQMLEADARDPELTADTYAVALAYAHHARRLAGTLGWIRAEAYVAAVDRLITALTDPELDLRLRTTVTGPAVEQLARAVGEVTAHRIPVARHATGK